MEKYTLELDERETTTLAGVVAGRRGEAQAAGKPAEAVTPKAVITAFLDSEFVRLRREGKLPASTENHREAEASIYGDEDADPDPPDDERASDAPPHPSPGRGWGARPSS